MEAHRTDQRIVTGAQQITSCGICRKWRSEVQSTRSCWTARAAIHRAQVRRRPDPALVTRGLPIGLTGSLERTLRTTNIIENLMGSVEGYTRRVKRWRGGQMIQRWVASALVEAEPRFRRVRGYRDLRYLVGALDALAPPDGAVADVA